MKTCSAPIFVFRWKPETGKAPGKQRKTRSFPQKRAQINRPWGDPSAKCGKLFCFFVSGRHFLGRTGLQSAVFPLHPVLFQVEGNSKKEQFCADVCPASREESPESEIIFQQGKSALRLNGAAQPKMYPPWCGNIFSCRSSLFPEGLFQCDLFGLSWILGSAALGTARAAIAVFAAIPRSGNQLSVLNFGTLPPQK